MTLWTDIEARIRGSSTLHLTSLESQRIAAGTRLGNEQIADCAMKTIDSLSTLMASNRRNESSLDELEVESWQAHLQLDGVAGIIARFVGNDVDYVRPILLRIAAVASLNLSQTDREEVLHDLEESLVTQASTVFEKADLDHQMVALKTMALANGADYATFDELDAEGQEGTRYPLMRPSRGDSGEGESTFVCLDDQMDQRVARLIMARTIELGIAGHHIDERLRVYAHVNSLLQAAK